MLKIGDFAKIFGITIKTVRYYESIGLIVPGYIDIYTGYRYFNDENLSLAIGKKGVNIRLASKLTKYKINVKTFAQVQEEGNK